MDTEKPVIALYEKRSFGAKLGATFDFIGANRRPLFEYAVYFLLPLCLILSLCIMAMMSRVLDMGAFSRMSVTPNLMMLAGYLGYTLLTVLFSFFAMGTITALTYTLMKLYGERGTLKGLTFSELRPCFLRNLGRALLLIFLLGFPIAVLSFLAGFFSAFAPWVSCLLFLVLLVISFPLALSLPAYMLENNSFSTAVSKSFRLGFATWGGVFGVGLVLYIICGLLQLALSIPWYICLFVKTVAMAESGVDVSLGFDVLTYFFVLLMTFGTSMANSILLVGLGFQYTHAATKLGTVEWSEETTVEAEK